MGANSTMIRLIDVVFILLFGFISISEISEKSQIDLPKSTEMPRSNPDKERVLFIGISSEGNYLVESESQSIPDVSGLYAYLQSKVDDANQAGDALRVRIRSNWDTPIKFTMAAADICDNLNIPKGIDVRRMAGIFGP